MALTGYEKLVFFEKNNRWPSRKRHTIGPRCYESLIEVMGTRLNCHFR